MVIPEGDATRYRIVLSILFGITASIIRKTSDDAQAAPVLFGLDEAGNIPIHNLSEQIGVGRGRRSAIVLGYQSIGQVYKQHGRDGAQAVLGSVGTTIFLPGLDSETAIYAAKRIGRTTVLQHTTVDAPGTKYDNERDAETGRDLLDAAEIRQIVEYSQAVAISGTAPPVIFGFPPCRKTGGIARPLEREVARPTSLRDAEMAMLSLRNEEQPEQRLSQPAIFPQQEKDAIEISAELIIPPIVDRYEGDALTDIETRRKVQIDSILGHVARSNPALIGREQEMEAAEPGNVKAG